LVGAAPRRGERHLTNAATTLAGGSGRGARGGFEAMLAEIRGIGEPGCVSGNNTNSRASIAAAGHLLDSTVVETS